ncbi:ChbG/HpnK family deacetylase [Rhizobium tubonense]|uniref:Amino acid dehydrogenase n=1 Tax=Rhizobium tubonense TaxID=484088 RepID=A0A2W4E2R7_9HYPH|nr:ChbG/HpnK family deacetylase [Rhizobium tubonense]PZM09986.1 amino acid dehydrogenase [Rhizobium tubonense]
MTSAARKKTLRIADDFGLGRGHDRIILELIEGGRLDGTSVMINDAIRHDDIVRLRALQDAGAKVGLHLNLTQAFGEGAPVWSLASLMRPTLGPQLLHDIEASLIRQSNKFVSLFGKLPDFYDGHQHCHCFPAIAPLVLRLPRAPRTWVRVPLPATWAARWRNLRAGGAKGLIIMAMAARARAIFVRADLQTNKDFSGFLRLGDPGDVRMWLPRLLSEAEPDCLMMFHPGDATDPMQCAGHAPESRAAETEFLTGSTIYD